MVWLNQNSIISQNRMRFKLLGEEFEAFVSGIVVYPEVRYGWPAGPIQNFLILRAHLLL